MPAPPGASEKPEGKPSVPRGVIRAPGRTPSSAKAAAQRITAPAPQSLPQREEIPLIGSPLSDRPTQEPPSEPRVSPKKHIAPPPPKLPTMGPEPEFSFGIEELPRPPLSDQPPAKRESDQDLSWDLRPSREPKPARAAGVIREVGSRVTPVPLSLEPQRGDAHGLVERASVPPVLAPTDPQRELDERFALGDFSGALVIAESILADESDHADAQRIATECRAKLQAMYTGRLGSLKQVPVMAVPRAELKWLSLDHRAGFVLSLVDGTSTMEEIIDVSGMAPLEVLRTLFDLVVQRVIEFKPAARR
jgi:hypothetical protein